MTSMASFMATRIDKRSNWGQNMNVFYVVRLGFIIKQNINFFSSCFAWHDIILSVETETKKLQLGLIVTAQTFYLMKGWRQATGT